MRIDYKVPFKCEPLNAIQDIKVTLIKRKSLMLSASDISKIILQEKHPYISWDNIDFQNLENDSFSLSDDNVLGFVRHRISPRTVKKLYVIKCDICSNNKSLWGLGVTLSQKNNYISGKISCSCSKSVRYTEYQNTLNALEYSAMNNYNRLFIGWVGEYKDVYTKVNMFCFQHGSWKTTPLIDLRKGKGCNECGNLKISNKLKIDDSEHIERFKNYIEGTTFKRSDKQEKNGRYTYWDVTCPICSNDEYVKNGLCSGVFTSHVSNLQIGKKPCRCSTCFNWTDAQRKHQLEKKLKELSTSDVTYKIISIDGNSTYNTFNYMCSIHGTKTGKIGSTIYNNSLCDECGRGEAKVISKDLDPMLQSFEREKMFEDCVNIQKLRFDRYIPSLNILLEYDGRQHFDKNNTWYTESAIKRDRIKTEYAINNGYNFIRIAYYEDHVKALESFLALVLKHQDKQIVQIYGEVQILDKN